MQKTFAIIFAVLLSFIFMLCALEPIIVRPMAAEINNMEIVVLSIENKKYTSIKSDANVYLYLSDSTPLTVAFLAENKDYYVQLNSTRELSLNLGKNQYKAQMGLGNVKLSYATFATDYEADPTNAKWQEPINVENNASGYLTIFDSQASAEYKENFLNVFGNFFSSFWDTAKTVINFVVSHPIVLISVGVAFFGSVLVVARRLRY